MKNKSIGETLQVLDRVCWQVAKKMSLDLDAPQEECADWLKQSFLERRIVIEWHPDGKRFRFRLVH